MIRQTISHTAVIVGATGGIGSALVKAVFNSGRYSRVHAVSRTVYRGSAAIAAHSADVTDEPTIQQVAEAIAADGPVGLAILASGMLHGTPIARAFAEMASRPSAPHIVQGLSHAVGLSRSAFMARFSLAFGKAPMALLRRVRMRQAAALLAANAFSIDQVALQAGCRVRERRVHVRSQASGVDLPRIRQHSEIPEPIGPDNRRDCAKPAATETASDSKRRG
jgi:AraC-like DNA-binding protein